MQDFDSKVLSQGELDHDAHVGVADFDFQIAWPSALSAAALLSACGGGTNSASNVAPDVSRAASGDFLSTTQSASPQASAFVPTPTQFMDWMESNSAANFPPHQTDILYSGPIPSYAGMVYRYYSSTGNYLMVLNGICYVNGPVSGGVLSNIGSLASFGSRIQAPPILPTDAARFLHQAQFSASDVDIASVQGMGFSAWLDQQLNLPVSVTGWNWLMAGGYNNTTYQFSTTPADYMVWNQLITSPDTLRKRFALALSEIFVVSSTSVSITSRSFAMAAYWDMLNANAFGTYRQLLEAVTLNPAMGVMLNTKGNQKENVATGREPDENYGREVMQLMSIGLYQLNQDGSLMTDAFGQPIPTYGQSDITNIARVFTGWDFDPTGSTSSNLLQLQSPMRLTASLHSTLGSSFLGVNIPANTDGTTALRITLDALANHPNVGPFLGRQLIERLVTSNPSNAYIGRVAAVFNDNGAGLRGDLRAVLRAVLLDTEARSSTGLTAPSWGKLREPMIRFVQWARTFNATSSSGTWPIGDLSSDSSALAQSPMRSPSVFNFFRPGYVPPNTALATIGQVAPEFQITNESTVASYINFMQGVILNGIGDVKANYANELALVSSPTALLNRLNLLLTAGQLSASTLSTISAAISSISTTTASGQKNFVCAAILLVMASPQYIVQK